MKGNERKKKKKKLKAVMEDRGWGEEPFILIMP